MDRNARGDSGRPAMLLLREVTKLVTTTSALLLLAASTLSTPPNTAAGPGPAAVPDTTWPPSKKKALQYADPSGLWRVVGRGASQEAAIEVVREARCNPLLAGNWWPGFEVMLNESGDWYVFSIGMRPGYSILLSAESTITLIDKRGRRVTGQMRLLSPTDKASREVFDLQDGPLLVYPGPFLGSSVGPSLAARFPPGSVRWKNIRAITASGVRAIRTEGR